MLREMHKKGSVRMCDTDERVEEMLTSECLGEYGYDEVIYLTEDIFLPALIGVTTDNCAVYSYNTIIELACSSFFSFSIYKTDSFD